MDCGTLWYVAIEKTNKKEREWIDQMVRAVAKCVYDDRPAKDYPDWITDWVDEIPDQTPLIRTVDKKITFESYGDSGEDIKLHAAFIRKFLERFRPGYAMRIEYSTVTSRGAEFGGGVYVITAECLYHMTTWDWADERIEELELVEVGK